MKTNKNTEKIKITKPRNTGKKILGLSFSIIALQNINFWCSYSLHQTLRTSPIPSVQIVVNDKNESIPTINIPAESSGRVSKIFNFLYNGEKISDFEGVTCKYTGDPELADEIMLDKDFSIKWTNNIKAGKHNAKWSITYKGEKIDTPQVTLNCLSAIDTAQETEVTKAPAQKAEVVNIQARGVEFKYCDDFFANPSSRYNPSLAVASYGVLSCSGNYEGGRVENSDMWIKDLMLNQFQFKNYEQIGYRVLTTDESIGAAISSKEVYLNSEKATLLCLPIRSFSYNDEWTDNMFVGDGTSKDTRTVTSHFDSKQYTFANKYQNHAGFCLSAMVVLNFLRQYIEKYNITGKIKLWIAGYSRGGAVANLTAALLDRAIYEKNLKEYLGSEIKCNISHDDIFAYTMGTPQGAYADQNPSPRSAVYNNIFNLINPNDIVTHVPLRQWGFTRYGIDKYMTTKTIDPNYEANKNSWKKQMQNPYNADKIDKFCIYKMNGDVNEKELQNITPQVAWDMFTSGIAEEVPTRQDYAKLLQWHLKEIMSKYAFDQKDLIHLLYAICNGLSFIVLVDNVRVDSFGLSLVRGTADVIGDIHAYDNYFSYAKANDLSYVSENNQAQLFDEYTYYDVYSRGFDQVNMFDKNRNSYIFKNFPQPEKNMPNQPYSSQVSNCVFDYPIYPYYIEAAIPAGYNIDFKVDFNAIHVWGTWDGYLKITTVSSNPNKNGKVLFYEEHGVSVFHSYHSGTGHLD